MIVLTQDEMARGRAYRHALWVREYRQFERLRFWNAVRAWVLLVVLLAAFAAAIWRG